MKRVLVTLAMVTAALGMTTVGSASADPAADKSRVITTDDGWQLQVSKIQENLDRAPGLTGNPFTHEGFVSLEAVADITGHGKSPVMSGSVTLGYQVGCQVDVSSGLNLGVSAAFGPNVGVSVAPVPGMVVGGSALAIPSVSASLKAGAITNIPFATKPLAGPHGSITTSEVDIKIDSCLGRASIRSYAIVSISTKTADNSVAVYGDPIWL